jgi:8-oxo-dGDP phosphatase
MPPVSDTRLSGGAHVAEDQHADAWTVLSSRPIYESRWVKLGLSEVVLPSGQQFEHHTVTMPAATMAVVLSDDRTKVLLSWRHRFVSDTWNYELPGGLVEEDEPPERAIAREILEETGYTARTITHLATFEPMIGMVSSPHHVFMAEGVTRVAEPTEGDEGSYQWVPIAEVPGLIRAGKVRNSGTLVGLLHYLALDAGLDGP